MGMMFNAPPGWPEPPAGWMPPLGWQPDPSWPAPPPGWSFTQRANPHAFGRACAVASVPFVLACVVVLSSSVVDYYRPGEVIGRLLWVVLLLPTLLVGVAARLSRRRWGWGRYVLLLVPALFFSLFLSSLSAAAQLGETAG